MAEGILGRGGRQLPHPRDAVQLAARSSTAARQGVEEVGDPTRVPRGRHRCPRAEIRRRHHHPAGLRRVRHRRQQARRSASTTRARTSGPSATPSGAPDRRPARPDRLHHLRRVARSSCSCLRSSRRSRRARIRELAGKLASIPAASTAPSTPSTPPSGPARSTRRSSTIAARKVSTPPKTHWAHRIETPPFYAYPLRPGITFTYLGDTVNENARIIMKDGRPPPNMFAAGEMMAGNVLGRGYLPVRNDHRERLRPNRRQGGRAHAD